MRWALLFACAGTTFACSQEATLYLEAPWPKDQLVVVTIVDPTTAQPLEAAPHVQLGSEVVELRIPKNGTARVLARAYPANLKGPDLETPAAACDIGFRDTLELDAPLGAWISPLITSADDHVTFATDDGAEFSKRVPLGFGSSCAPHADCAGFGVELLDLPPHIATDRVVAIDNETAYIFGVVDTATRGPTIIARVDTSTVVTILPEHPELISKHNGLLWDPHAAVLWVATGSGVIRRYTRELVEIDSLAQDNFRELHQADDGTVFIRSKLGLMYEATSTSTIVHLRSDFPPEVRKFAVARRDRIFVHATDQIYGFDGTTWRSELNIGLIENLSAIGADDESAAMGGELELVRVRNEAMMPHLWNVVERPFDVGARLRGLTGAGHGRFLVAGDSGAVGLWTGAGWCKGFQSSVTLETISVTPDRRHAYVVTATEIGDAGQSVAVRVSLPRF